MSVELRGLEPLTPCMPSFPIWALTSPGSCDLWVMRDDPRHFTLTPSDLRFHRYSRRSDGIFRVGAGRLEWA
jgi:hypothetical protein